MSDAPAPAPVPVPAPDLQPAVAELAKLLVAEVKKQLAEQLEAETKKEVKKVEEAVVAVAKKWCCRS